MSEEENEKSEDTEAHNKADEETGEENEEGQPEAQQEAPEEKKIDEPSPNEAAYKKLAGSIVMAMPEQFRKEAGDQEPTDIILDIDEGNGWEKLGIERPSLVDDLIEEEVEAGRITLKPDEKEEKVGPKEEKPLDPELMKHAKNISMADFFTTMNLMTRYLDSVTSYEEAQERRRDLRITKQGKAIKSLGNLSDLATDDESPTKVVMKILEMINANPDLLRKKGDDSSEDKPVSTTPGTSPVSADPYTRYRDHLKGRTS